VLPGLAKAKLSKLSIGSIAFWLGLLSQAAQTVTILDISTM